MKISLLLLHCVLILASCSTATKVNKVKVNSEEAVSEKIPLNPNLPQIKIRGYVVCDRQIFVDYNTLKIDLRDNNNKLGLTVPVNVVGGFEVVSTGVFGKHAVRLIEKKSKKVLDKIEFSSSEKKKQFDIKLTYCK